MTQSVISTEAREDLFEAVAAWTQRHLCTGIQAGNLADSEALAEEAQQIVGQCVLEVALSSICGKATYEGVSLACPCGEKARFVGYRERWVKSLCGEARIKRAYYHCASCKRGIAPWDKREGLNERVYSARLKALVCQVMGRLPYEEGVSLLEELRVVRLQVSSAEEIVAEVGERIRCEEARKREAFEARQEARLAERLLEADKGDTPDPALASCAFPLRPVCGRRLYIEADAAKAHIDGDWHDVKVGGLFSVCANKEGVDTPAGQERSYLAGYRSAEEFGWMLRVRAAEWGHEAYPELVFLADGADSLWNQAKTHFPQVPGNGAGSGTGGSGTGGVRVTHILDFYHASEHIWTLGRALYRQEDAKEKTRGDRWIQERVDSLKTDGPGPLLRALKRRKGRTAEEREALRREYGYFTRNRDRMNYPVYRARGMMIGSGPIEAGCKVVVGQRLKQAGMRWSSHGADAILAVRTTLLSRNTTHLHQMARAA